MASFWGRFLALSSARQSCAFLYSPPACWLVADRSWRSERANTNDELPPVIYLPDRSAPEPTWQDALDERTKYVPRPRGEELTAPASYSLWACATLT
jgi:hypothetical protein